MKLRSVVPPPEISMAIGSGVEGGIGLMLRRYTRMTNVEARMTNEARMPKHEL